MPTTTVRIGERAHQTLKELAEASGKPMTVVIEDFLARELRERMLADFNTAYAALRDDPVAWEEELEERRAWDGTLLDGQRDEEGVLMADVLPSRGEVWMVDLSGTRGHEQAGVRPAVIVSVDTVNHGPAELVIAVPITSRSKNIPAHIPVQPPEGGLTVPSFIKCEDPRSLSHERLIRHLGSVSPETMVAAERWMRVLLGLR